MSIIGFNLDGPDLSAGTDEFLSLMATIARDGFTEAELQRARQVQLASLQRELAQISTRQDSNWADLYVAHFLGGADASRGEDRAERISSMVEATTATELSDYFRWLMETSEPIVIVVGPDAGSLPTVDELTAVVADAVASDGAGDDVVAIDRLMDAPDEVDIAGSRTLEAADGEEWTFDNGARVIFSRSEISSGSVNVFGLSEGGWSLLPVADQPLLDPAVSMVSLSGVGDLEKVAMDRYLSDKTVGVSPFAYETGEGIQAQCSPEDLEIAFQLIHLYLTQPRVDDSAFNRVLLQQTEQLRSIQNDPRAAANEALTLAINDDDPDRNPILDRAELDSLTPAKALELYEERMTGVDDLVLVVVGDAEEDDVEELARRYVGTIPPRPADTWTDLLEDRAPGVETVERNAGPAGSAGILSMLFATPTDFSDTDRVHAEVLEALLSERLFTRIREQLGASYNGGSASVTFTDEPSSESQLAISVTGDPERLDEIRATLLSELAELDSDGPSEAEYERAIAVVRDNYNFISNGEIIDQLLEEAIDGNPVLTKVVGVQILEDTTRSDIAALASDVIDTTSWIEIFVTPSE